MKTEGMEGTGFPENKPPKPPRVTEPPINSRIDDGLINAVITAAVWSVKRRPRVWNQMIAAMNKGAKKTKEGTAEAFFFHAMVDRLLEEYRDLEGGPHWLRRQGDAGSFYDII